MGVGCGLPAWIDEAEQLEGGSPTRRRRCKKGVKVSTWKGRWKRGKCGFWQGGGGGEVDISAEAEFWNHFNEKLARKVSSDMVPYSELCTICEHHKRFR